MVNSRTQLLEHLLCITTKFGAQRITLSSAFYRFYVKRGARQSDPLGVKLILVALARNIFSIYSKSLVETTVNVFKSVREKRAIMV